MMTWSQRRVVATALLALAVSLAICGPSNAQLPRGQEGTGGAAGYSPPMDEPAGGAAPMNAPPPADDAMGAPAPEPDTAAPPTDENKQEDGAPASDDAAKDK